MAERVRLDAAARRGLRPALRLDQRPRTCRPQRAVPAGRARGHTTPGSPPIRKRDDVRIFGIRLSSDELIGSCQLHSIRRRLRGAADPNRRARGAGARLRQRGRRAAAASRVRGARPASRSRCTCWRPTSARSPSTVVPASPSSGGDEVVEVDGRKERVIRMVRPHVVAIHQPNFFPWLGLLRQARALRTHSCCSTRSSSPKAAGRTASRCWSAGAHTGSPRRYSVPGSAGPIRDLLIDERRDWRTKSVKTLQQNYLGVESRWRSSFGYHERGSPRTTSTRSGASQGSSGSRPRSCAPQISTSRAAPRSC